MEKAYKIAKRYIIEPHYYDLNTGVRFLKKQTIDIEKFNITLLGKYKDILSSEKFISNVEAQVIHEDITVFINHLNEYKKKLLKSYNIASKGAIGEDKVRDILYSYDNQFNVIQSARFNIDGISIENDFLVISKSGITSIEVKNIGNCYETLHIDQLGRISRKDKFNKEISTYDMIEQSNRHMAYMKRLIEKITTKEVPLHSVIVLTSGINIINNSEFKLIGTNQIYNTLSNQKSILNPEEVESLYNGLYSNLVPGNKYQYLDYISSLNKNYNLILKSLSELNT